METKRSGSIDLIKFLLIISITLYHGIRLWGSKGGDVIFYNGGSAVEPFYIIAGFFMARSACTKNKESFGYMWGRYKQVFPYHIFAFVIAFFVTCFQRDVFTESFIKSLSGMIKLAVTSVPDFFLLAPISGLQKNFAGINGIEWYLSAMLVAMALLYPFLRKWTSRFCCYAAPLIFLFGSGVLYQTEGSYIITFDLVWIICGGLIRALATISAGIFIYWLCEKTKETKSVSNGGFRLFATIMAFLCWIVTFWFFITNQERSLEFSIIYFMIGGVFFSGLGITYTNGILSNRFVGWLAKLSFPMFLNQSWVRKVLLMIDLKSMGLSYPVIMIIFVGSVIVVSIICMIVMDNILNVWRGRHSCKNSA